MRLQFLLPFLFLALCIITASSCRKDRLLTSGGRLEFSTDTLNFDTVFTSLGSFTLGLKIFNPANQPVRISSVRLEKGPNSFFHLNVNGIPGNNITDIELAPNDSTYVFATVTIDPNSDTIPFIVEDRLIASLNGQDFSIPVFAYGQNAYYLRDSVITQNDVWKTDKPYVILHSALIEKGYKLEIPPGCRVYMHADSRLYVRGTLWCGVGGSKQDTVVFQGDRLDRDYFGNRGYPGEWGGIYIDSSSTGNRIEYTTIKNCGNNIGGGFPFAIEVFGSPGIARQLTLNNTVIDNSFGYGILCFQANVEANNCLVYRCGAQALAILQGGEYEFNNCNFINLNRSDEPAAAVLNFFAVDNTTMYVGDLKARFRNCLIYGTPNSSDSSYDLNQLICNKVEQALYDVEFRNCLITNKDPLPDGLLVNSFLNEHPYFTDEKKFDFRPKSAASALVDRGIAVLSTDLDGTSRPQGAAHDIGCYEFKP